MRVSAIVPAVLMGLALFVGACGGGGGDGDAASTPTEPAVSESTDAGSGGGGSTGDSQLDVCSMITAADVEGVLGEAAEPGVDESVVDLRACSWKGATTPTEQLTISIYVHPDADTARDQYLTTTEDLGGVEILNLADEALYTDGFGLRVLKGRYDVAIDSTADDRKATSLALAQKILPQLP